MNHQESIALTEIDLNIPQNQVKDVIEDDEVIKTTEIITEIDSTLPVDFTEGSFFENFKLKLAGDKHTNSSKGQYVTIPYFIEFDSKANDAPCSFKIVCTRLTTSDELLQIFESDIEPKTYRINEYKSKNWLFSSPNITDNRPFETNIQNLKKKFNIEFSKAEPNCGSCIGEREDVLYVKTLMSSNEYLHIVKVIDQWPRKKTPVSKFLKKDIEIENKIRLTDQRNDTIPKHHGNRLSKKVTLMEYRIPSRDELVTKDTSEDVLLIIAQTDETTFGDVLNEVMLQKFNILENSNYDNENHKNYSDCTKLYIGDIKYIKIRESQQAIYDEKFSIQKYNRTQLFKRNIENPIKEPIPLGIGGLKKSLQSYDKINRALDYNPRFELFHSLDYGYDSRFITYSTRNLTVDLMNKLLMKRPTVKTTGELDTYQFDSFDGRLVSTSFMIDPKFHIDTIIEAYDRYMKFLDKYQCKSCGLSLNHSLDINNKEQSQEYKQFLTDFEVIHNHVITISPQYVSNMLYPNFNSFLNSITSGQGVYNAIPDEPQYLHLIELTKDHSSNNGMKDMILIVSPSEELDLTGYLLTVKEQLLVDNAMDQYSITEDVIRNVKPINIKADLHVDASELFEQEIYSMCNPSNGSN
ncbi:hypothetical protein BN7_5235 [Wickerhamomyces ciferrii]|uniref:Uncharacterized protein n=1 Tax=Wickerhamomyces ciferrii (strain ATCC 14091 / BCRC 22168 / CBS 111 / JCM 3599 / NBRC 0793 / NRRL Y-1031 F-60-10) TaxID=1206466 RepID=K0KK99_WICCF|nr:uncharacterized protein BN7_5235 [Wickerhamomyces ciferrii]CCH45650.1 hypothetical protein BN7_5235 [Wickerhamomyces ciferrii]